MLMEVRNSFRYFKNAIKVGIKSAMAYKASFIVQSLFMMINNAFFLMFWGVVFRNSGSIDGVSFNQVLYIWSFSTISFGIAYFFFGGVQNINEYIITGKMDGYLLQPKNVLLNVMTSKCIFSAFGDLLYGIIIGIIATGGNIEKMLIVVIIGVFGSVFFISTEIIVRAITVWVGDTKTLANRYIESLLITFSTYPEKIFSTTMKALLYTVIPVAYLSYIPTNIVEHFDLKLLLLIIVVGVVYMSAAIMIFNKAMKSYESGNGISMKG